MPLKLNTASGGSVTLDPANTASNFTLTVPAITDTAVTLTATQTLTNKTIQGGTITSGTAVASTSGTSIDFTGIPSWVKRITVMLNSVSTNGTSQLQARLGTSSGVVSSGYAGNCANINAGTGQSASTAGHQLIANSTDASFVHTGQVVFTNISGNIWVGTGIVLYGSGGQMSFASSVVTLSGTLDRVRITTANGTDTFDAGSINILYE